MKLPSDYSDYHVILWKKEGQVRHYTLYHLSFEFLEEDFDYVLFLKFDFPDSLADLNLTSLRSGITNILLQHSDAFIIITNKKAPPIYTASADEFVYSFGCDFQHFKAMVSAYPRPSFPAKYLLFELLDQIFNNRSAFRKILIRQAGPGDHERPLTGLVSPSPGPVCDVIIPHRGDNSWLKHLLHFLEKINNIKTYIGIDQKLDYTLLKLKHRYNNMAFYNFSPAPVGPYVIRNHLINESKNELLFFQDSDDIPCADRFGRIAGFMSKTGCQLCGSHELRLDYFDRSVRAYRFPEDVLAALKNGPWHPLLHPSSAITRTAFELCGRLSEERTFGNDTKFLLHSFFLLHDAKNVDEFLYIRRRHPDSLTTSPDTMIGSPLRSMLLRAWNNDFEQVKYGKLKLENSSLRYVSSALNYRVNKI